MTVDLSTKLEALDSSVDYTDPNTYAALLYGDQDQPTPPASEGVTEPAAVVAPAAPVVVDPAPAAVAKESSEPPAAAEQTASEPVDGVLTKDGKRVIPYAVLEDTRKTAQANASRAKELADANARMHAEIEALKAGKTAEPAKKQEAFSDERIASLRDDMPEMADLMEAHNAVLAELKATREAIPAQAVQPPQESAQVQALIDARPLLAQWQATQGPQWVKACELDVELQADPAWAGKSEADRFAAVEASIAARYGIAMPQAEKPAPPPAAPQETPQTPAAAVKQAAPVMPTLSDFGGNAPVVQSNPMDGLAVGQMVDKVMSMDMESIRRMAGLPY